MLVELCMSMFFFFFFQAEDGIRDTSVTGVQTCALPIWLCVQRRKQSRNSFGSSAAKTRLKVSCEGIPLLNFRNVLNHSCLAQPKSSMRSEERRVGKESRYQWATDH